MSFYPQLFEKEDKATTDLKRLAKAVGKRIPTTKRVSYAPFITSTVTLSPDEDKINRVGQNKRSDIITKKEYDEFQNTIAKDNLRNFLQTKKNINIEDLDSSNITFAEFWDYEFSKVKKTGEFKKEKASKIKEFNFVNIDENDVQLLFDFYKDNNKEEEFKKFLKNLPTGKDFAIYFSKEVKDIMIKHIKDDDTIWTNDMINYLTSMHNINDFVDPTFLRNQIQKIFPNETFIHALYYLKPPEIGRGELLISYLFEDSSIQGGSQDFDIILVNGETYEIKDYISESTPDGFIRLGAASGGKAKFPFYDDLIKSRDCAVSLFEKYKNILKSILHPEVYDLWEKMSITTRTKEPYQNTLGAAIASGEIGKETLNRIIGWHYFAQDFINDKYKNITKEIPDKLSELKYVNDPEKIKEDFDHSPQQYFKNVGKLTAIIVFRKDKIRICKAEDLKFAAVSQSLFKFIEISKEYKPSYRDEAYKEYKKLKPDLSYADFFVLKQEKQHEDAMEKRYLTAHDYWEKEKSKIEPKKIDKWLKDNPEPLPEGYYPRFKQ